MRESAATLLTNLASHEDLKVGLYTEKGFHNTGRNGGGRGGRDFLLRILLSIDYSSEEKKKKKNQFTEITLFQLFVQDFPLFSDFNSI